MVSAVQAVQVRLARHYLDILQQANAGIRRGADNRSFWLKRIRQDWEQIKQWQTWSASQLLINHDSARLCTEFTSQVSDILRFQLTLAEELLWAQQALEAARSIHDKEAEPSLLYKAGFVSQTLERLDQADQYANELMATARAARDDRSIGRALYLHGTAAFKRGDISHAETCYTECLAKLEASCAIDDLPVVWRGLGLAAYFRGNYQQAQRYQQLYLTVSLDTDNAYGIIESSVSLSAISLCLKDYVTAGQYAQRAVDTARTLKVSRLFPQALLSLAHAEKWLGHFDKACIHYEEALEAAPAFGSASTISNGLYGLAQTKFKQGDYTSALSRCTEALEVARSVGHAIRICEASHDIVFIHLALNDLVAARTCLQDALQSAKQLNTTHFFSKTLAASVALCHGSGLSEQAAVWAGLLMTHTQFLHPSLFNMNIYEQLERELGEDSYRQALEQGQRLTLEMFIQEMDQSQGLLRQTDICHQTR